MGNSQSAVVAAVPDAVAGGLLYILWTLLGRPGTLNDFIVPPLAETNRAFSTVGEHVTPQEHAAMGTPEARVRAMRYATSGTCARVCRSEPRAGEVCGQKATTGDCGRHR
jgi:hypothetical protein